MPAFNHFPQLTARSDVMPTFGPECMQAARRFGRKAARRDGSPNDNPYPAGSCASTAWFTGFREAKAVVYQVNLLVDGAVIDAGHSTNCKHAIHGAYQSLAGIPQAEVCVRANGRFVFWLHTDFHGEINEIECHFRHDSVVLPLNPKWKGWPQFANTPKGTVEQALVRVAFDAEKAVVIAADSWPQLRKCDVFRLFDSHDVEHWSAIYRCLKQHRPELAFEAREAMADLEADGSSFYGDIPGTTC